MMAQQAAQTQKQQQVRRVVIIRIKGTTGLKPEVKQTLKMLRLYRKHTCVIIANSPSYAGMLEKVKETVTWGELDNETCKILLQQRGKLAGKKPLTDEYLKEKLKIEVDEFVHDFMVGKKELRDVPGLKEFFTLKPPTKGFERRGIKIPFSMGGVLGYRKNQINDLVRRMV